MDVEIAKEGTPEWSHLGAWFAFLGDRVGAGDWIGCVIQRLLPAVGITGFSDRGRRQKREYREKAENDATRTRRSPETSRLNHVWSNPLSMTS